MENTVNIENADDKIYTEDTKKSKVGRIINMCLTVALFTFIIAFMFRLCQADNKELEDLHVTENLKEAYKNSTDVRTHAAGSEFSDNGALYAYSFVYIPESKYMQITVRYNDRHINEVVASLNENDKILKGENAKEYTVDDIKIYYTLTDSNEMEYSVNLLATEHKYNYTYFKLEVTGVTFENVSLYLNMIIENTEQTEITLDGVTKKTLVYKEGSTYNSGILEFHNKDNKYIPYDFSKKELKELN